MIESFLNNPDVEIDIVGPIEEDVIKVFEERLSKVNNIRFHGFVDTNSEKFSEITKDTSFLLYPSCTEGAPGAVNVAMKMGIIPIVSRVAAPDDIKTLGFLLDNLTQESINKALEWIKRLSNSEIQNLITRNHEYAKIWTLDNFGKEFSQYLQEL